MSEKEVEFVFLSTPNVEKTMGIAEGTQQIIKPDDLKKYLEKLPDFEVASITLSIAGFVETGGILRFIVTAGAEAGVSITLTPKKD